MVTSTATSRPPSPSTQKDVGRAQLLPEHARGVCLSQRLFSFSRLLCHPQDQQQGFLEGPMAGSEVILPAAHEVVPKGVQQGGVALGSEFTVGHVRG